MGKVLLVQRGQPVRDCRGQPVIWVLQVRLVRKALPVQELQGLPVLTAPLVQQARREQQVLPVPEWRVLRDHKDQPVPRALREMMVRRELPVQPAPAV